MKKDDKTEQLLTSMCVWEAILEMKETDNQVKACFENIGTNAVRWYAAQWCEKVDAAWDALTAEQQEASVPFDWEFVPEWLAENVDWSNPHLPSLRLERSVPGGEKGE